MPFLPTHTWTKGTYDPWVDKQLYNGLDTMITLEVFKALQSLRPTFPEVYNFSIALQGPVLDMMSRGLLVDEFERQRMIADLTFRLEHLNRLLQQYAQAVWDAPLNARSSVQLQKFFFEKMNLPPVWSFKKGEKKLSMDREALEKLHIYHHAKPIINVILAIRDLAKQREVLVTEVEPDGRMRTSYNIAGTETARFSSSSNAFGTGTNLQNIARDLRHIFIADKGRKICGIDLEQAESREVAWLCWILFNDSSYMDACLSGDLHTTVSRLGWPHLPWTGDIKKDRAIAEGPFYRWYTFRDMAKKLGHGSNYFGKPPTMARHAKIPTEAAANFQFNYFFAFPGIPKYHTHVAGQIQTVMRLTTPFNRTRDFFGRSNDDTTLREAIAYVPQSATADRLNLALWRIWHRLGNRIRLLAQVHDALYFDFDENDDEADIISTALSLIDTPMQFNGRTLSVPGEAKTGWNWGDFNDDPKRGRLNPGGLRKFKGEDKRTRPTMLERVL